MTDSGEANSHKLSVGVIELENAALTLEIGCHSKRLLDLQPFPTPLSIS